MPVIGPRAAIDLALPTGVDGSRILAFQMRNGRTAQEIVAEAASILGTVNESLAGRYGSLWVETQLDHSIAVQGGGGTRKTPIRSEFKRADPVRGDIIGNMLRLIDYDDAVAWTPLYLRDAWDIQITADLQVISDSFRNRVDSDILTRLFTNTEIQIGTGGYDVPFAIGSGVTVAYIPPNYGGYVFDSTHTHFLTQSGAISGTTTAQLLNKMVKELKHHGHTGRLVALVSDTDIASYAAMTGFVKFIPTDIQVIAGNTSAPVYTSAKEIEGFPGELFGYFLSETGQVVQLRAHEKVPTGYAWMGKSYGTNNIKNPLALREHPAQGFGLRVRPQVTSDIVPELDTVLFDGVHGVGVNDRTNGVVGQLNTASFSNPTIP